MDRLYEVWLVREHRPQHGVGRPRPRGEVDQPEGAQVLAAEVADPDAATVETQAKPYRQALRLLGLFSRVRLVVVPTAASRKRRRRRRCRQQD